MKNRNGFVYALSLGVIFFITVTSASLLMRSISEVNLSERSRSQYTAFQMAEAGVDQAMVNLHVPTGAVNATTVLGTLPTGTFTIDPTQDLSGNRWRVQAHGRSLENAAETRDIEAILQLTPASLFQYALFANLNVGVSGSATTDSYDSRIGPYNNNPSDPGYNKGSNGDVGTNSTAAGGITVSSGGGMFIDGQLVVGAGADPPSSVVTCPGTPPDCDPYVTANPWVVAQSEVFPMPPVVVPTGIPCSDRTVTGGTTVTLTPTGGFNGTNVYCYHDLTLQGNSTFTASGDVVVYLTGVLTAKGNTTVGVQSDPSTMLFKMSPAANADLAVNDGTITGNTGFYGAIYGPEATLTITGSADIYGSVVADTINVAGNASIHYDERLQDFTQISNLYRAALISWREY